MQQFFSKSKRVLTIMLLVAAAVLAIASFNNHQHSYTGEHLRKNTANSTHQNQNRPHPYGRPVTEHLTWEFDQNFLKVQKEHKAFQRLAAFQTTLPNPLPGEEDNVALAADILAGTIVKPGQIFSMNASIGPYTKEHGFKEGPTYYGTQVVTTVGGGVCKIASTLYNTTILANLKVIERHPHGMLVPYVPPGQDATVSFGNKDFKFQNDTEHPLVIWSDTKDTTLQIAFYSLPTPPKVSWHSQILNRQPFPTIYRDNRQLKPGQEKIVIPGDEGLTVKSWVTVEHHDGRKETKTLGIDYYKPMPRVVERGVR